MAEQWYVARGKEKFGPYSAAQLKALATQGRLVPTDMLHKEGMPKWVPADKIKGLFVARAASMQPQPTSASPSPPAAPVAKHACAPPALPPSAVIPKSEAPSSDLHEPVIHPNSRAGQMIAGCRRRRIIRKGVIFVVLACLTFSGVAWFFFIRPRPGSSDGDTAGALEVTAKEILEAYGTNMRTADEKYKGKTVQIEGVLLSSHRDNDNRRTEVSVVAEGGVFDCFFDDRANGDVVKVPKSDLLAVRGVFGFRHDRLVMEKCEWVEPKPRSLELSASQLNNEFRQYDGLAIARYKGKTLLITGTIAGRDEGPAGLYSRVFLDCGDKFETLECKFKDTNWGQVAKISEGRTITVRGRFESSANHLWIDDCELVKVK